MAIRWPRCVGALPILFFTLGCVPSGGAALLGGEVWRASLLGILGGGLIGGILGLLAGGLFFRLLRRRGAYALPVRGETWIRRGLLLCALTAGGLGGASTGALQGGWWSFRHALARGPVGETLDAAGVFGADLMISLHHSLEPRSEGAPPDPRLPVADFLAKVEALPEDLVDRVIPALEARWPALAQRLGPQATRVFARILVRKLAQGLAERPLKQRDPDLNLRGLRRSLLEAADQQEPKGWIPRASLGRWMRERLVEPMAVGPVRTFVRGHQLVILALVAAAWILPVLICAWVRKRMANGKTSEVGAREA